MTKRILLTFVQFVAFCALFFVGGYWQWVRFTLELRAMGKGVNPPPMIPLWKMHVSPTLDYLLNGLVFAAVLLVIVLVVQALRGKLRSNALWTLGAFVAAFLLSLLFRSGFILISAS